MQIVELTIDEDASDVDRTLQGDGEAYRRLIVRYQQEIAIQMSRFSRDRVVCETLVHDVFVEAYVSLRSYRGTAPWLHWLRRIAVRVGYRYWKDKQSCKGQNTSSEIDWQNVQAKANSSCNAHESADWIHALLAQLPPSDRLVLTLVYLDSRTIAEAAALAGWTVVGTKVRAFRARNKLKKLLERGDS